MPELKNIPINEIICLDTNPRSISNEDLNKLAQDIDNDPHFLQQRPPLVNHTNGMYYCYAGTQRVKACKILGYSKIECFVENHVSEKLQNERMLKDNLHRGQWNKEKLFDIGFEIEELQDFGFDDFELDNIDLDFPTDLTAPKKDNPPTIKITFNNEKQMNLFESHLKSLTLDKLHFSTIKYSISLGEL